MRFVLAGFLLFAILTGCATGERIRSVQPGMPRAEVISVVGEPDRIETLDRLEILLYLNRMISGWSWDRADYKVQLEDGKVLQWSGELRAVENAACREQFPKGGFMLFPLVFPPPCVFR